MPLSRARAIRARVLFAVVALVFGTGLLPARAQPAPAPNRPWIFAADIHLDPTGRWGNGRIGSDSNPALLASAIRQMQQVDPDPPVVLLGGDFLAHIFDQRQALPTMRAIAKQFDRAFPSAQFIFVLGNEDSDCGDYHIAAGSAFLRAVTAAWEPLVNRHGAAPGFARTFAADGYYVAQLPVPGLRAVIVDDVFWSPRYRNACGGAARPGLQSLHDIDATLRSQPAEATWVFVHIPPGIDAYSTSHVAHGLIIVPFLDPRAKDAFLDSVTDPKHDVRLIVAAHVHKFGFRIAASGNDAIPILMVPSISPIFDNAPSFLTVHVGADKSIVSAADWSLLNGQWADRGGLDSLGMPDISAASIERLQRRLAGDSALREMYALLYEGGYKPEITAANWRIYWCAATELSAGPFRDCTSEGGYSIVTGRGLKVIAVALFGLLVLASLVFITFRTRKA